MSISLTVAKAMGNVTSGLPRPTVTITLRGAPT